jgi:hypothetical protein
VVAAYQATTDWHLMRPQNPVSPAQGGRSGSRELNRGRIRLEDVDDSSD